MTNSMLILYPAHTDEHLPDVRKLFEEYAASLLGLSGDSLDGYGPN